MPIRDCPIYSRIGNDTTVFLPIKIVNPHANKTYKTYGLIDTGATECAIPAAIANILGHNLKSGIIKQISTGNGLSKSYSHTSTIIIYHPQYPDNKVIYTLDNVLIDFMPDLPVVLLGVRGFLSNFILKIDYPEKIFSLIR